MPIARELLLVEDDPSYARLVLEAARRVECPYDVLLAANGERAVTVLRQRLYQISNPHSIIVLLDLGLPGVGGLATLQTIKSDPVLSSTPVIMLTGSERDEDKLTCYRLGATNFLTKPYDFEEIVSVLKTICRHWTHYTGEV